MTENIRHIELNNQIMNKKDGFFDLEKDKEAIKEYMKYINKKTMYFNNLKEKLDYLIKNNYYVDFYEKYIYEEIEMIFSIAASYKFKFQSYMAASKFYESYALTTDEKENRKYLENYAEHNAVVALYLANGDVLEAEENIRAYMEQRVQPATPTYLNAGRGKRGEMVSCFLLNADDSLNSINFVISTSMQLSKIGGGVAINLSKLRGRGEPIKGVDGSAKGIMPVLKLLEDAFSYADQMGQRKGSGAAYYSIFGWDLMEFLDSKKINADEKSRLQRLSIGLIIPERFYKLAEANETHYVFAPYSVYKAYNQHLDDMDIDQMYDTLLADPRVKKKAVMSARDMLVKIAQTQLESGYPYIMNKTNANEQHALGKIGEIKMSNLCTEIFQLQETSHIGDYDEEDIINNDISCNLASLNIVPVMELKNLRQSVHTAVEGATAVSDMTNIKNAPTVQIANKKLHSIGIGAMNLHGYLAKNKIPYESEDAKEFVRAFFSALNFYSLEKSMLIAKENGSFDGFGQSDYANGSYFNKYLKTSYTPQSAKVKSLFEGIHIPTPKDWSNLKETVMKFGLYHAYRLAIAPTQSISYVQNATSSVMPIVEHIETRTYANSTTYYPMPYMDKENFFFFKSAYNMDMLKVIDLVAEIQPHIDQGISTILHVNSDISTRELARYYIYAKRKGLKSLYYTRTNKLTPEDCTSCSV